MSANKILEGMARAYKKALAEDHKAALLHGRDHDKGWAMAQALLFLSSNVSDEMVQSYLDCHKGGDRSDRISKSIAAALRAAASEGEAT